MQAPAKLAAAWRGAGLCYFWLGNAEQALVAYRAGLEQSMAAGDGEASIELLRGIGRAERQLGNVPQALEADQRSVQMCRDLGDRMNLRRSLNNLGGELQGRARALSDAALEVMRQPEYRHPFYWAGFVMIGDGF